MRFGNDLFSSHNSSFPRPKIINKKRRQCYSTAPHKHSPAHAQPPQQQQASLPFVASSRRVWTAMHVRGCHARAGLGGDGKGGAWLARRDAGSAAASSRWVGAPWGWGPGGPPCMCGAGWGWQGWGVEFQTRRGGNSAVAWTLAHRRLCAWHCRPPHGCMKGRGQRDRAVLSRGQGPTSAQRCHPPHPHRLSPSYAPRLMWPRPSL